jgi:quercetin dioxygenase-like cupin family protein
MRIAILTISLSCLEEWGRRVVKCLNSAHDGQSTRRTRTTTSVRWDRVAVQCKNSQGEKPMKPVAAAAALLGGLCFSLIPQGYAQESHVGAHTMVTPSELQWKDAAGLPPGAKIVVIEGPMNEAVPFTVRIKFPAGSKVPAHWHPGIEHVTVISGVLNMGVGDKLDESKTTPLQVGSISIMQPKTTHFATTNEETTVQIHGIGPWQIIYVNPADDPRKTTN